MTSRYLILFILISTLSFNLISQEEIFSADKFKFKLEKVYEGENSLWGMDFLPDGSLILTSRSGKILKVTSGGHSVEIKNVPKVKAAGQGGMLDVKLHPDFEENGWIYISYSKVKNINGESLSTTAVDKAVLKNDKLLDRQNIFEALPYGKSTIHYGSRLEFDNKKFLYISVGDRGQRSELPQSLQSDCGKVHRMYDDGRIPNSNPFTIGGKRSTIYSYGHRNPQGMARHPKNGSIWTHEHGPQGGDEINIIKHGANYGWPLVSYGINYNGTKFTEYQELEGMESPLHYWDPSIAPCGMTFITSDMYPGWTGNILIGSLKFQYLHLCILESGKVIEEKELLKNIGRIRNVKEGPDGYLYISVESPGRIYKIIPLQS